MNVEELNNVLKDHLEWLKDNTKGKRANLSETNLFKANLSNANLLGANLFKANLSEANLFKANLSEANLFKANLSNANLLGADLSEADLSEANLSEANLFKANLSQIIGKRILTFQAGQHFAWATDGFIKIGCLYKSASDWTKEYKEIGKENGYSEEEIKMYGDFINYNGVLNDSRK